MIHPANKHKIPPWEAIEQEVELIKTKKSKLSANQRRAVLAYYIRNKKAPG